MSYSQTEADLWGALRLAKAQRDRAISKVNELLEDRLHYWHPDEDGPYGLDGMDEEVG